MSVNIWDAESQEVKKVAGNANINDGAISENSTWSSKKIDDEFSAVNVNLGEKADKEYVDNKKEFSSDAYGQALIVKRNNENAPVIRFENSDGLLGYMGLNSDKTPFVEADGYKELATMDKVPQLIVKNFVNTEKLTSGVAVQIDNSMNWWAIRDKIIGMNVISSATDSTSSANAYLYVNVTDGCLYLMPLQNAAASYIYMTVSYLV